MNTVISLTTVKRLGVLSITLGLVLAIVISFLGVLPLSASAKPSSYIVQGYDIDEVVRLVEAHGGTVTSRLEIINGVAAILSPQAVEALLQSPGITSVVPNAVVRALGDSLQSEYMAGNKKNNVPATDYADVVGADLVWARGVNGQGVTVAIVDTGMSRYNGLLTDADGQRGRVLAWKSFVDRKCQKPPCDDNGHGSHIGGIIANSDIGADGEWNGIAPGVKLVVVQVLNGQGEGSYETVINGIQWVIQNKSQYNIRVMNLSLVSLVQSPYWADPLNQAVMRAWAEGIVVVVAAGNGGPAPMTVGVPGNNPYVITVGAFTDNYTPDDWADDYVAPFSATGPTLDGFVKPDVVAPGAHMISTMENSAYLAKKHQANKVGSQYFEMAGTSQAAAVTSGVAALILSQNPALTPDEVKYRIMSTTFPWVDQSTDLALYSVWQQGWGRLNAPDAVFADVQGVANLGLDVIADLTGSQHFEGYSYYDEASGTFRLYDEEQSNWLNGLGIWAGDYAPKTGVLGVWADGLGIWAGGRGVWAGGRGVWAGGMGVWAGGRGVWAGGRGVWAGGFGVWAGGYDAWTGGEPWVASGYASSQFVQSFLSGVAPNVQSTISSIGKWVDGY